MQQTRLNTLFSVAGTRLSLFFGNPWRRVSLLTISLLFGIFIGSAVSTTAGQDAEWDVSVAAIVLLVVETISVVVYRRRRYDPATFWFNTLNAFKIGLIYSLFLEAFKLGS
ncbi:MAG: DUF565 domain-containing protein [Chloroflexaceae bacterium]|nr:DUF565 domain-containing protein [Chloroflexaceae bacterium]